VCLGRVHRPSRAIREVGGTLIACHDITDSVGILDSYFPDARFFTDGARFEDFLSRVPNRPDYDARRVSKRQTLPDDMC
jgi:hypothetical protein